MRCIAPFYTRDIDGLSRFFTAEAAEGLLRGHFAQLAAADDAPTLVCDSPALCALARAEGLACLEAQARPGRDGERLLPAGARRALADALAAGLLEAGEPVLLVDVFGAGARPGVRQAARERFAQGGGASLLSLAQAEDHPVQVRSYHAAPPLGLAYFLFEEAAAPCPPCFPACSLAGGGSAPALRPLDESSAELLLPRALEPGRELLAAFALTREDRFLPVGLSSAADGLGRILRHPPRPGLKGILVLHLGEPAEAGGQPFCAVPVLFEGAPWTLGRPNHLYAPTPCVNAATGRLVLGRQEFPPLLAPTRELAVVTPARLELLDEDLEQGRCLGFVSGEEALPLARLFDILRQRGGAGQEDAAAANPAQARPGPLFPPAGLDALRGLRTLLGPAMADLSFDSGELAAYAKGCFDYLYETTMREQAPEQLHKGM